MAAKTKTTQKNALIGAQAQPTVLDSTTKLDIDTNKTLIDNIIEASVSGGLDVGAIDRFTSISNSRDQIYTLIDTMAADASVSSLIRTYAENVCEPSDDGHIVWCESSDPNISKFVNYLLNVMNVDKNIFSWAYCLIKYGDVYLKLFRESDYDDPLFDKSKIANTSAAKNSLHEAVNLSIHKTADPYSYYVEMVNDPGTMFELTKYGKTYGYIEVPEADQTGVNFYQTYVDPSVQGQPLANYRLKSNDVNIYQADDYVHACLNDNVSRFPETVELFTNDKDYKNKKAKTTHQYQVRRGKSLLYDSYKIWREKSLLENSALLNRITRSSVIRNIQVEVGDMSKEQAQQVLRRLKDLFEQKTAINTNNGMAEYTNPGALENNIFTTTHGGQGQITINSMGGDINVKDLADLDWWNNKFYASYGIPKQYFGWTDDGAGFNGGTSLTILSSIFAKGVKRVQNELIQMLSDAISLILINKGLKSYLNNFVIKMKAPLTQEELDYRTNLVDRVNAISNIQSLLSDVEDKSRRLTILKDLLSTLNYGDEVTGEIQKEIDATIKAQEEAKKTADQENSDTDTEQPAETEEATEELDLNNLSESFKFDELGYFTTDEVLTEEAEDLPTPKELDDKEDFTKAETK